MFHLAIKMLALMEARGRSRGFEGVRGSSRAFEGGSRRVRGRSRAFEDVRGEAMSRFGRFTLVLTLKIKIKQVLTVKFKF